MRAKKPRDLASLLKLLREHGVTHFKDGALELHVAPVSPQSFSRQAEQAYLSQVTNEVTPRIARDLRAREANRKQAQMDAAPTAAAALAAQLGASAADLAEVQALFPSS